MRACMFGILLQDIDDDDEDGKDSNDHGMENTIKSVPSNSIIYTPSWNANTHTRTHNSLHINAIATLTYHRI